MTEIQSALFDDWQTWPEDRFALHQLVSTGERLTRATFAKARAAGGTVIIHGRSEEQTRAAIASPLAMIASDGFIEHGRGHPRTSGSYAKVLGKYVRDDKTVTLMDALRRMTLDPAHRLEKHTPAMANKGRVKVGADADLAIFDPATVIDRSTYEDASIPSAGIPYVIVGGQVVVDGGNVTAARPGHAIRAPIAAAQDPRVNQYDKSFSSRVYWWCGGWCGRLVESVPARDDARTARYCRGPARDERGRCSGRDDEGRHHRRTVCISPAGAM
jgi:dihydroorotase